MSEKSSIRTRSRLRAVAGGERIHIVLLGTAGIAVLLVTLEVVSRLGLVNERFLPPFSTVVVVLGQLLADESFRADVASTLVTWAAALAVSAVVAIPLGLLLGLSDRSYRLSRTVIELVRTMPAVALVPLAILLIGQGFEMKLTLAVYAAMWPILFNSIYGARGVDPKAKEMGRSFGLSRAAIIRRISVPSAAPFIFTGVRISSSIVLIVIITVELITGGAQGLGSFIARQRALGGDISLVYAAILVTGLLGLFINSLIGVVDRRLFAWNQTKGGRR